MTDEAQSGEKSAQHGEKDQRYLSQALENTLEGLNQSIERMEQIVRKFEAGETDLDESISLLAEANELAVASSKELDRAVQKVVYETDDSDGDRDGTAGKDDGSSPDS